MIRVTLCCLTLLAFMISPIMAQAKRDPFKFGAAPEADSLKALNKEPHLTLILISEGRKLAIIGGRGYRVGEKIEGGTITGITLDSVTATIAGGTKVYLLREKYKK